MQIFGSKPKPQSKPKASSNLLKNSANPGSAPPAQRKSAGPSSSSKPTAQPSAQQQPSGGTTEQQAASLRKITATISETHELAGQAVGYLADMATPRAGEEPNRIEELVQALATIAESQARLEHKVDRLLNIMRPRPA